MSVDRVLAAKKALVYGEGLIRAFSRYSLYIPGRQNGEQLIFTLFNLIYVFCQEYDNGISTT